MSDNAFVWKNVDFGTLVWKIVECFKWGLIGYPSRNMEDFVVESDLNCADLALVEMNFRMWPKDCFCDTLVKNVAAFCPSLQSI